MWDEWKGLAFFGEFSIIVTAWIRRMRSTNLVRESLGRQCPRLAGTLQIMSIKKVR